MYSRFTWREIYKVVDTLVNIDPDAKPTAGRPKAIRNLGDIVYALCGDLIDCADRCEDEDSKETAESALGSIEELLADFRKYRV